MAKERRVKKKDQADEEQSIKELNLGDKNDRLRYINNRLDDIMVNIGGTYGKRLTDELMQRLEKTIKDFNDDVEQMLDKLELISKNREKEKPPESDAQDIPETETAEADFEELSAIEKRLEKAEQKKEKEAETGKQPKAEEQNKEKKPKSKEKPAKSKKKFGLFGQKKQKSS